MCSRDKICYWFCIIFRHFIPETGVSFRIPFGWLLLLLIDLRWTSFVCTFHPVRSGTSSERRIDEKKKEAAAATAATRRETQGERHEHRCHTFACTTDSSSILMKIHYYYCCCCCCSSLYISEVRCACAYVPPHGCVCECTLAHVNICGYCACAMETAKSIRYVYIEIKVDHRPLVNRRRVNLFRWKWNNMLLLRLQPFKTLFVVRWNVISWRPK